MVLLSGVKAMPVTSLPLGAVRKRRYSLLPNTVATIWLLPMPAYSFMLSVEVDTSV